MEKQNKTGAQIYGYTVCLVAVITFLICVASLVNAITDMGDPLHAGWNQAGAPSLASFENYKMDILRSLPKGEDSAKGSFIPDDQTLRGMYESAKNDKIQQTRFHANQTTIISSLLIAICIVLFITHWRWMRKITRGEA
jgi:hypothetical protein